MDSAAVSVAAGATIDARAEDVFDVLGDLDRHRDLADDGLQILDLEGARGRRTGGLVELRGPVGLKRLARTSVGGAEPPFRLWGTARTTDGACALMEWRVKPEGERTHVEVQLDVRPRTWSDRTLLSLGGRAWLRNRLDAALDRLAQSVATPEARTQPSFG